MTTAPHFPARLRPVPGRVAMAVVLVFLSCALATGARAQCVCLGDCSQCVGCPQNYTTPFPACDRCYSGVIKQGAMSCTFTGKLMGLPGSGDPQTVPSDTQLPDTRFPGTRLPGTRMGTTISPF
jgi:hypothetical protein